MYSVSEAVESEDLALYVCLTADNIDRPFTVTLSPISGTAIGNYFAPLPQFIAQKWFYASTANEDFKDSCKDIEFAAGVNVRGCGCVGILSDSDAEGPEMFEIAAIVSDESIEVTGQTTAGVVINDN